MEVSIKDQPTDQPKNGTKPHLPWDKWVAGVPNLRDARQIQHELSQTYRTACGMGDDGCYYVAAPGSGLNFNRPRHTVSSDPDPVVEGVDGDTIDLAALFGMAAPSGTNGMAKIQRRGLTDAALSYENRFLERIASYKDVDAEIVFDEFSCNHDSLRVEMSILRQGKHKFAVDWNTRWSKYQLDAFGAVLKQDRSIAVVAVAGSGKTTLIKACADLLRDHRFWCLAFNKVIAQKINDETIGPRCAGTTHSAGWKKISEYVGYDEIKKATLTSRGRHTESMALKAAQATGSIVDFPPLSDLPEPVRVAASIIAMTQESSLVSVICRLADKRRLTLADDYDWMIERWGMMGMFRSIADEFNKKNAVNEVGTDGEVVAREIEDDEVKGILLRLTDWTIAERVKEALTELKFEYIDQIWLPAHVPAIAMQGPRYDFLFVDEAQDLCAAQMAIVRSMLTAKGRVILVGDPRQAINGWAGADDRAFNRLIHEFDALVLPLSICYRCPTSHIALAQSIVDYIQPRDGAPEGVLEEIAPIQAWKMAAPGDMFICRRKAPLYGMAIKLLLDGFTVELRTVNIGKALKRLTKGVFAALETNRRAGGTATIEEIIETAYIELEKKSIEDEDDHYEATDLYACLEMIIEAGARTEVDVTLYIDKITGVIVEEDPDGEPDPKAAAIVLSSIHRAKGLEADRVFVMEKDEMALYSNFNQDWQNVQEANCKYVGLTRAKKEMYLVDTRNFGEEHDAKREFRLKKLAEAARRYEKKKKFSQ